MSKSIADPRNAHATDPALPERAGTDGAAGARRAEARYAGPYERGCRDGAMTDAHENHGSPASEGGYLGILHRFVRDTRPELSESETVREVRRLYWGEREGPRPPNEQRERERIARHAVRELRRDGC